MSQTTHKKPGETLFGFLMVIISVLLFWQAYKIAGFTSLSSPGAFPMAAAAIMVITSCVVCVKNLRHRQEFMGSFMDEILPPVVAVMIGIILLFAVMLEQVGFILTTLVFLFLTIKLLHRSGTIRTLLLSVLILTLIYVVFRLVFQVILPEGIVPEREIMARVVDFFSAGGH